MALNKLFISLIFLLLKLLSSSALTFTEGEQRYAYYPPWNVCPNASISFDFKTDKPNALLLYVDDNQNEDFVQIQIMDGTVRLVMTIFGGKDGNTEIILGRNVNDSKWHTVKLKRNRMAAILTVDNQTEKKYSFGSDMNFGNGMDSSVWFGGIPTNTGELHKLSLPSVFFLPKFVGKIRNVIYNNCTCHSQRVTFLNGTGVNEVPPENCGIRDPCREGCLCISSDADSPHCDCSELECLAPGKGTHYHLSMDRVIDNVLLNPEGLDASTTGSLVKGVNNTAIEVDGAKTRIRVAGDSHRFECLGDLNRCPNGYTISFWINISHPVIAREQIYLSNGAHSPANHGVMMSYNSGNMRFKFKNSAGQQWTALVNGILPGQWYHVTATWHQSKGLLLYINGLLVDTSKPPETVRAGTTSGNNEFVIGRANDASPTEQRKIRIDEFHFWGAFRNDSQIRESGPLYALIMPFDQSDGRDAKGGSINVHGSPTTVKGMIRSGLSLNGRNNYVDGGDTSNTCFGDVSLCAYGLTAALWVQFLDMKNGYHIISTGDKGLDIYIKDGLITAEVQYGDRSWIASWPIAPELLKWYYIEATWDREKQLRLYVDQKLVGLAASSSRRSTTAGGGSGNLLIGKPGKNFPGGSYANVNVDDVELWYGDRDRLIDVNFLQRGRPTSHHVTFDDVKDGTAIMHSYLNIRPVGTVKLTPGKIGSALQLDGSSYVSMGKQGDQCLGNLDLCQHGLLFSVWIKPTLLERGMDFFSTGSNGIKMKYLGDGTTSIKAKTTSSMYELQTKKIIPNEWQFVEINWDRRSGLELYVNQELVGKTNASVYLDSIDDANPDRHTFYLGRGDGLDSGSRFGKFQMDDLEYWHANRQYLLAFNYIQRGEPKRLAIDMNRINGNTVVHDYLNITARGNPVVGNGKVNGAIRLNGQEQYLDAGDFQDCFGDISKCSHGITGSFFFNFRDFKDGTFYLSNGGGLAVYRKNSKLYAQVDQDNNLWKVELPELRKDTWYFIEFTWHPEKGLQVFLNFRKIGEKTLPTKMHQPKVPKGNFLVGKGNVRDGPDATNTADGLVDELELWEGHRDYLIAFDHILRDKVPQYSFPMEMEKNGKIVHPDFDIFLFNNAGLTQGKVGKAVKLEGNGEYVRIKDENDNCMENLEKCLHGLTISMFIKPEIQFGKDGYILSSGAYSLFTRNDRLVAQFNKSNQFWEVSTKSFKPSEWQKVELSWNGNKGLEMFIDGRLVETDYRSRPAVAKPATEKNVVYLGRPIDESPNAAYGNVSVDELEFWFADRNYLKAFDYLRDDIRFLKVDMERITGDQLVHPTNIIYTNGYPVTVPGVHGNGVYLNGNSQYLDLGNRIICNGNPQYCTAGFTTRVKIKPHQQLDNTYFISSPFVNLYHLGNRLIGEVKTSDQIWKIQSEPLDVNAWNQVDLSWHPAEGLSMFVNNRNVARVITGQTLTAGEFNETQPFYIGRTNTNMIRERYANIEVDDFELWEAKRESLVPSFINPIEDQNSISRYTIRPSLFTPTTTTTTAPRIPAGTWFVFNGKSWMHVRGRDLYYPNYTNTDETLNVRFQTLQPDGLIWSSGSTGKFVNLFVKDGLLYVTTSSTSGDKQNVFKVDRKVNDNMWHDVHFNRHDRTLTLTVDGETFSKYIDDDVSLISSKDIYISGSRDVGGRTINMINSNFKGNLSKVIISGSNLSSSIDILKLYQIKPQPPYLDGSGEIKIVQTTEEHFWQEENEYEGAATFNRGIIYFSKWEDPRSVEFSFKTTHPDGLILYHKGTPDSFSVELFDGVLYANIGPTKYPFDTSGSSQKLNDNQPHRVRIDFPADDRTVVLRLDEKERIHNLASPRTSMKLQGDFFIGGVEDFGVVPWTVWTRKNHPYLGCLWGLRLNSGTLLDLGQAAKGRLNVLKAGCHTSSSACSKDLCGKGTCSNVWNGFKCDCSKTAYSGERCEKDSKLANFNGQTQAQLSYRNTFETHTNDISMRFKTPKENGLLMYLSNNRNNDFFKILLENGMGKIETNLGGQLKVLHAGCDKPLNDNSWHTIYVKRRANYLEANVDECVPTSVDLSGTGYTLDIDKIYIGKKAPSDTSASSQHSFVGSLQNVFVNDYDLIDGLSDRYGNVTTETDVDVTATETDFEVSYPATFREHHSSYLELPPLTSIHYTNIELMFKTTDPNGLILFNTGPSNDFFASELVDGKLKVAIEGQSVILESDKSLADDKWHLLELEPGPRNRLLVTLDKTKKQQFLNLSRSFMELHDSLYVGGVPENVALPRGVTSGKKGFTGCLASFSVNGRLYNLIGETKKQSNFVTSGCTSTGTFCSPGICQHFGVCSETADNFHCDCSMTSYVGHYCEAEAEGYRYGLERRKGIAIYRNELPFNASKDKLAFGFMTWRENGTLIRIDGAQSKEFIEAKMEKGNVVFAYNIGGDGEKRVIESSKKFNDGNYHFATFVRDGATATVRVDELPAQHVKGSGTGVLSGMSTVSVGGKRDSHNKEITNHFDGIIAGVNLNSHSLIEEGLDSKRKVTTTGDVLVASHPFLVAKPETDELPEVESEGGATGDVGGGVGWKGDVLVENSGQVVPQTAAVFGLPSLIDMANGPRAAVAFGAMIASLVVVSSIMWAAYKIKPGWISGGSSGVLKISSPNKAYQPVGTADTDGKAGVAGMGSGAGGASDGYSFESANANATKSSTTFTNKHYEGNYSATEKQHLTTSTRAVGSTSGSSGVEFSGTMNRANQTEFGGYNPGNIYDTAGAYSSSTQGRTLPGNHGFSFDESMAYNNTATSQRQLSPPPVLLADGGSYQMRNMALNYSNFNQQDAFTQQQLLQQQQFLAQQQQLQQQQQQQQTYQHNYSVGSSNVFQSHPLPPPLPNLMSAEEIKVDCVQLTTNGRYVVTGSVHGPPQVWDMKSGELVRIMQGDDFSSTDLHLANGDTLLIGQIADQFHTTVPRSGYTSTPIPPGAYRKLQVWDFNTGKPMEMRNNEFCTASCLMNDGDRMVLGRSEKMGSGTTIVIWDILGNEPIRQISWPGFVGSYDDPLSYISLSKDNRYILVGAQNSSDGSAHYVMFDLTVTDFDRVPPTVVSFNAQVDTTTVLENQEAVTGTRIGELVVWSLRTGKALRQLVSPSGGSSNMAESAHRGEVTCVCLSKDSQYLVSSSTDGTLKIWNMESERLLRTLVGHRDEVWCCTISNDNELVVSGSRDNTIKLWRVEDGGMMASIQTGVDVFRVLLSNNKRTVVALADRFGSRKLIMLQVVRTKVRSSVGSRATSPMGTFTTDSNYRY